MVRLTISKEKALSVIHDRMEAGKQLLGRWSFMPTEHSYQKLADEHENWRQGTGNMLRQIFNDESVSKNFLYLAPSVTSGSVFSERSFSERVDELDRKTGGNIQRLHIIHNDIIQGVYEVALSSKEPDAGIRSAKIGAWATIVAAVIGLVGGGISTYVLVPAKPPTAKDKQGLENITLVGKWLYVCTDYNGTYQHGGRFRVIEQKDGALQLVGERSWKDTKDTTTGHWSNNTFEGDQILPWKSNWIYVHDGTQFNMAYDITVDRMVVNGYCTGTITSDHGEVQKIEGYFYQLLPQTPILAGRLTFTKVTEGGYNEPVWKKNH